MYEASNLCSISAYIVSRRGKILFRAIVQLEKIRISFTMKIREAVSDSGPDRSFSFNEIMKRQAPQLSVE